MIDAKLDTSVEAHDKCAVLLHLPPPLQNERSPTEAALFFGGLQARRSQPPVYMRNGFELAQFAF
ncbi:hypothetical protein AC630_00705 [Bradyrhizobium sp. AS23.2]|nr:hypothetical protein AC630_00705 [Bradyrhizobium sp. AS23.2]